MEPVDPQRSKEVLERVESERGMSRLWPKILAEKDPDLLENIHNGIMHVLDRRNNLPKKYKTLIMMCLNAFSFYEYGFRVQVRSALKCGATEHEILEALEVVSLSNLHGMTSMLPALAEELQNHRSTGAAGSLSERT